MRDVVERNWCSVGHHSVPDHLFDESRLMCVDCHRAYANVPGDIHAVPDKQQFPTGAVRDTDTNKTKWSLLPWHELERVVRHTYMPGADHYGDHNWQKGIPSSRCLESLQRHVLAFSMGDTSEDHLGRAVFGCLAILYNQRVFKDNPDINDLPGWEPNEHS